MKKVIFSTLAFTLLACMSCTDGYVIKGTVPEGADSVFLTLSDTAKYVSDTAVVSQSGKYIFIGKTNGISTAAVRVNIPGQRPLFVSFPLMDEKVTLSPDSTQYGGYSVSGSLYNDIFSSILETIYRSEDDNEPYRIIDSLQKAQPGSPLVPYLVNNIFYTLSIEQYDSIVANMDDVQKGSPYLAKLSPTIEALHNTAVGQPFADFTCKFADGTPFQLSSIAGKGNWLLLDFWASWCRPCRHENPNVVKAYGKFHDKGFDIVGVSLDKDMGKWQSAIEKDSLTWTHVSDLNMWETPSRQAYGIMSIPSNIMINPDGIIVARNLRGEALQEFLEFNLK